MDIGIYEFRITNKNTNQSWITNRVTVNAREFANAYQVFFVVVATVFGTTLFAVVYTIQKWQKYTNKTKF
jgi:hypothetical protein